MLNGRPHDNASAKGRSRWERSLDRAHNVEELLAITRDYVASLPPRLLSRLPQDCRPGPIKYEDDIDYWAYQLSQHRNVREHQRVDGNLLHDLRDYFLHALIRLAELRRNLPGAMRIQAR
jgi:hypothetical protein